MNNNTDFGINGIWGIIMLLIVAGLFSGGTFGFGGNAGVTEEYIANQFTQRDLYNNNTNILDSKYDLANNILENRYNAMQNACNTQQGIMESRLNTQLGFQQLQGQLAQVGCDNRYESLQNANNIMTQASANTQKILDKMCENEVNSLREKVSDLKDEISNRDQSSYLLNVMGRWYSYPSAYPYFNGLYNNANLI